jgi:hypothetical protein
LCCSLAVCLSEQPSEADAKEKEGVVDFEAVLRAFEAENFTDNAFKDIRGQSPLPRSRSM